MDPRKPTKIAIDPDNYSARHVGKTENHRQFILTTPFEPATHNSEGCEYIALYTFDSYGDLIDSIIESFGPRKSLDEERRMERYNALLKSLGNVRFCRIEIKPFSISLDDTTFGLIAQEPEDEEDLWVVEMHPGNYMAFYEPWDSGDYDT